MSNAAVVSVVVPVGEAQGGEVGATIHSALTSELRALEVIVVQNGAPELPPAMWSGDQRVVTVRLRGGPGTSRPLNVGIARARAPYVAFLSPGDLLRPGTLSAAASALDRHAQAGFAFTDFEQVDAAGKVVRSSLAAQSPALRAAASRAAADGWCLIHQAELARALLAENFLALSSIVLRRQLLTEIGPFNEATLHCGDLDLVFRLAHCCDALYRDQVGHAQQLSSTEASASTSLGAARDRITVLQRESRRWSEPGARRELRRRIGESYAAMGDEERRRRHRLRSIAMFAAALGTFPQGRWLRGLLRSVL